MALFPPKKDNQNLRTLSETDIQKKLYGRLKRVEAEKEEASKPEPTPVVNEAAHKEKPSAPTTPEPIDLFSETVSSQEEPIPSAEEIPLPPPKQSDKEKLPVDAKVTKWVENEDEVVSSYTKEIEAQRKKAKKTKKPAQIGPALKKIVGIVGQTFFALGKVILGGLIGLIMAVDFRRSTVRKIAYWIGAALLIAGLLYGIHYLNIQRESAMTGGDKKEYTSSIRKEIINETGISSQANASGSENAPVVVESEPVEVTVSEGAPRVTVDVPMTNRYAIQVATYAGPKDAERVVHKLRDQDVDSFVKVLKRPSGKEYHCVFVGNFETFGEAETSLEGFKKSEAALPFQDAFIRKL